MRRVALIGHRGVGKSTFLSRVTEYYGEAGKLSASLDLDREIEVRAGRTVSSIFIESGEVEFRRIECETFQAIDIETASQRCDVFIALGAGFDPRQIPESWEAWWIRRGSDFQGRVLIDRPRLNSDVQPLEEFRERFHQRQAAYAKRADEILWFDEGLETPSGEEKSFVFSGFENLGGAITLLPNHFRTAIGFKRWVHRRIAWGVRWFELRDDILSVEQIELALGMIPRDRILLSFRDPKHHEQSARTVAEFELAFDWPIERGTCDIGKPHFLSSHRRDVGESIEQALMRFPVDLPEGVHFKAALPVNDFEELSLAHKWTLEAPRTRTFLPLSEDGRWAWYRLLRSKHQALGFFREGDGSGQDQPTLLQWARHRRFENPASFVAVLGDPVSQRCFWEKI